MNNAKTKRTPSSSKISKRTSYISARIEPKLKASASRVLGEVGLSPSDAITLFFRQVVLHQGLPFEMRIPNTATRKAIREARDPKAKKFTANSAEEMFEQILGKDWRKKYP
jgi:DNA-damage-inducible protein J